MRLLLRVLSLLAVLLGWLAVAPAGPAATAAAPAAATPTCAYDAPLHGGVLTSTTTVRGPPTTCDSTSIYDAVGEPSRGAVVRRNAEAAPAFFTYDRLARLVQVASAASLTDHPTRPSQAALSSSGRGDVAAKTTTTLADEAAGLLGNADDVVVLGRQADTAVAKGWEGHVVLDTPNWSLDLNDAFIRGAIDQRRSIYLASPLKGNLIQTSGRFAGQPTVYARELQMLREARYTRVGDYMVP